jgi:guanine nucleotide-binding protein subunit beta-2-like 1 protein
MLKGHNDRVTAICVGSGSDGVLVTGSRDKTVITWNLKSEDEESANDGLFGYPAKGLTGHNHFVTDLTMSSDNNYVISSSWDRTLRLWDINKGKCLGRFVGHDKEVSSVCFSNDNRQIFSGGFEKNIRIWNTLGDCKVVSDYHNHTNWVSKIRYSNTSKNSYYASVGRDGRLKIWNGIFKLYASIKAHQNYINALALNTNGQFIATGGKDNEVAVWDSYNLAEPARRYVTNSEVNDLAFNQNFQWLAAACQNGIYVWDISEKDNDQPFIFIPAEQNESKRPAKCTSIAWSNTATRFYVGCEDGDIRVYNISINQ